MRNEKDLIDEPNLNLSLNTPIEYELVNRIPTLEEAMNFELKRGHVDPNVDLKKLRRTISNRLTAQRTRTRTRRVEYATELEKKVQDLQDTIALVGLEIENMKDKKKKLQMENEILQEQLDSITHKSNLRNAQTEELKVELKRLKELTKAQKDEEHMEIEGGNSNSYDTESAAEIDQYLNLDAINFFPPKNDDM